MEEMAFDILAIFPEQVVEEIFENLSGTDLLAGSLVAKSWYDFIARNRKCMKKIKLSFTSKYPWQLQNEGLNEESKRILKESPRKYDSIKLIRNDYELEDVKEILEAPGRIWKEVLLILDFNIPSDLTDLLEILEPTVEQLTMKHVFIKSMDDFEDRKKLTFPKLKKLELPHIRTNFYFETFADCTSLTELLMSIEPYQVTSINAIHKIFRCNKDLKKLTIISDIANFDQLFLSNIAPDIKFRLQVLVARNLSKLCRDSLVNFKLFLETQLLSLETVDFDKWMGFDVAEMFFHMPQLKKLEMRGLNENRTTPWNGVKFHKSLSLKTLNVFEIHGHFIVLETFLSATPNLKHLGLFSINNISLIYVHQTLPNLESLSVEIFSVTNIASSDIFSKLKKFQAKAIHKDLELVLSADSGNFERLVKARMLELNPDSYRPPRYFRY